MRIGMKKHMYVIIVFAILIAASMSYFLISSSDAKEKKTATTSDCIAVESEMVNVTREADKNSIFPEVYETAALLDLTGDYSKEEVIDRMTSNQSLYWYAKTVRGLETNEAEYNEYMDNFIDEAKQTVEYPEIEAECEEMGISFEDILRSEKRIYERVMLTDKLYLEYKDLYDSGETSVDGTEYDEWQSYWDAFKAKIMKKYKLTSDYRKYLGGVKASIKIYERYDKEKFSAANYDDTIIYDDLSYKYDLDYEKE